MSGGGRTRRAVVVLGSLTLALVVLACGGDDDGARATAETTSPTAPPRPTTTTSTIYDPATTEGQVEAAYLKSWDVYADAVYNLVLDEAALAEVFTGRSYDTRLAEVRSRIAERRASMPIVDHHYSVMLIDSRTATVTDDFVNHHVLIDSVTKVPTEPDPNQLLHVTYELRLDGSRWRVSFIRKIVE